MPETLTRTQDAILFQSFDGALDTQLGHHLVPRLRLLYHIDPSRIGAISHPELDLESGEWREIGRKTPLFIIPSAEGIWLPLEDPTISRAQLRVRWLKEVARFEVEPVAESRRKLRVISLDDEEASATAKELSRTTQLEPGSCLAIDDRALIGLEVVQGHRHLDDDRLGFVGESLAMWRLRDDIRAVSKFQKPALILGPTGAGKELVALAIHQLSNRARRPFETVNCAALPEHLVESLLFGHRKGAFTGADSHQTGKFKDADGGTLFLDELGEMPITVQPKLLRTIQDGLVTPVGHGQSVEVNVRLVAATHRDPRAQIADGRLRSDLFHRLSAHIIEVPSLADRRFDIPILFMHFLARLRAEHRALDWLWRDASRWRPTLPLDFFVSLLRNPWEGNIRQLQNVVEQTARHNLDNKSFTPPTLPRAIPRSDLLPAPPLSTPSPSPPDAASSTTPTSHTLLLSEPALAAASRLLGLARKTLARIFEDASIAETWNTITAATTDDNARLALLSDSVSERLYALLRRHDFKQSQTAASLDVSSWTLIRLMHHFHIPRPSDLDEATIDLALANASGDLALAAHALKVSEHGLKKRLASLGRMTNMPTPIR
jgi:DNA-binding NtrC family response regulator